MALYKQTVQLYVSAAHFQNNDCSFLGHKPPLNNHTLYPYAIFDNYCKQHVLVVIW